VFVHCKWGISRSATVVLGYLMKHNGWTLSKAYGYLKKLRPAVQPNLGFQLVLRDWEKELFGPLPSMDQFQETILKEM